MNTTIALTLLLMGLTGGLHCAAMCGGLVVASERASTENPQTCRVRVRPLQGAASPKARPLRAVQSGEGQTGAAALSPEGDEKTWGGPAFSQEHVLLPARQLFRNQLQLQGARVLSYTLLGGIAGLIGAGVWATSARPVQLGLFTLGNLVLLAVGLWMISQQVLSPRWLAWQQKWLGSNWIGRGLTRLTQPLLSRLLPFDTFPKRLGAGLLWGLLPCGLVYSALSLAFLSATAWEGALAMLAFGLGTLPHMLFAGHTLRWLSQRTNQRGFHLAAGAVLLLFAAYGFWKLFNAGSELPMGGCAL